MANTNEQKQVNQDKSARQKVPTIAVTCGDPNGIGYEILLKALSDPHISEICTPIIYGNLSHIKAIAPTLGEEYAGTTIHPIRNAADATPNMLNIINCYPDTLTLQRGVKTQEGGEAAYLSLSTAVRDINDGKIDLLLTAPINKANIQSDKFRYSGHTEYLTAEFGKGKDALMMMVSDMMRVALVCNHVPLSRVPEYITEERITHKLEILNQTLQQDFTIRRPRIAVLALNPHAGDNGLLGKEEIETIVPAIKKAFDNGIYAFGPYSADGFFGAGEYVHFDAVLAMYHDQGLIPFKSLDMNGVNYTAGLDIIRTSPDHGTAYSLAGKNVADPTSFSHALYMAIDIFHTRNRNKQIAANPLPKQQVEPTQAPYIPPFVPFVPPKNEPTDEQKKE